MKRTIQLIFAAAVLACLIHPSASEGQEQYAFARAWPDKVINPINYPVGIAVDSSGNVYVADYGNHCIKVYSHRYSTKPPKTIAVQPHNSGC